MILLIESLLYGLLPAIVACYDAHNDYYPDNILQYHVRKDLYSHNPVTRGRLELIGGLLDDPTLYNENNRVSLETFKKTLQCAPNEPDITHYRGNLNVIKMMPPVRDTVEVICAWAEKEPSSTCFPWKKCQEVRESFKKESPKKFLGIPEIRLVRIMNGSKLYYDWPWGRHRFEPPRRSMILIALYVLAMVKDIQDSVFIMGEERWVLPWHIPFPSFSCSPAMKSIDFPWPWFESYNHEFDIYRKAISNSKSILDQENYHENVYHNYSKWSERIPKAVYYGTMSTVRQFVFEQGLLRPDLIEAKWLWSGPFYGDLYPLNPLSPEEHLVFKNLTGKYTHSVGYLEHVLQSHIKEGRADNVETYKYVIVLSGLSGLATSGRLARLLAHSGAVVLLQESEFSYHFSSRLKPWVHYVPLSYSAADVVDKILWLREHDHLAQRIALNARNFGRSYLRVEDYLCYVATAFNELSRLYNGSDALRPFDPVRTLTGKL